MAGLSRLYAVQQDHACHVNLDKNLAEMMEKFPHGAHTVPNGLPVDRETLDWVAPAGYELHVYPSDKSEFVRVTGMQNGRSGCRVIDQDGINWLVLAIPDPTRAGLGGPSDNVFRFIREDQVRTKLQP